MSGVRGDHEEVALGALGDREVRLERAARVEPLCVGDPSGCTVHGVGGQLVEQRSRIWPGHLELGHEGHVEQPHAGTHGPVLGLPARPEVGPAPRRGGLRGLDPGASEPVGSLPPGHVLEPRARGGEPVVQRRAPDPAGRAHRAPRVVALVDHPQALHRPARPIARRCLVGMQSIDVHTCHVDVRPTGRDPVGDRPAPAAAGQDPDRVQPGRDEVVAHLGRLADDRLQVRGEGLRPQKNVRMPASWVAGTRLMAAST